MTCIVGIAAGGHVWIGGDSAAVSGWDLTTRADRKVFRNGPCVMGFTSSFRMGQLLAYSFTCPERPSGVDLRSFMVTRFIDAVRVCLKDGGYARKTNETEAAGSFLVGYAGHLFRIEDDYQVAESAVGYEAVGAGAAVALGAMFATPDLVASERVLLALNAAEAFSAAVRRPFNVESL